MDFNSKPAIVIIIFIFTFLLNIFFGYFRGKSIKFSFKWFLYIHLPVPFVFLVRFLSQVEIVYIPVFAVAAIAGQIWGGKMEF
ncbi:MAG: hypothetical protein LLF28_03400 [Nitrospiraceae bacterium]|nr:hypothetical protein [Nitrospiraceae bacterium]